MIRLFDYVFYRVCKAYKSTRESTPEGMAMYIVTVVQSFNVMSLLIIRDLLTHKIFFTRPIVITFLLCAVLFNYLRYIYKEDHNYPSLKERWNDERNSTSNGIMVLVYLILSMVVGFGLAIYGGSINRSS